MMTIMILLLLLLLLQPRFLFICTFREKADHHLLFSHLNNHLNSIEKQYNNNNNSSSDKDDNPWLDECLLICV